MYDVIPVSNKHGHRYLFITMNSNPKFKEIHSALLDGPKAEYHPDISFRVLHINLRSMKVYILCAHPFAVAIPRILVVVFQEHAYHILKSLYSYTELKTKY